jgi:serine/threonine protein kinase
MDGTLLYMAPEGFNGSLMYDNRIDVFSYGVSLDRIFRPKPKLPSGSIGRMNEFEYMIAIAAGERFNRMPEIPEAFWKLITSCWKQEPEKRPSFHEITEMMLNSDDFTFPGTDLDEYHEYQSRIIRETNDSPIRDSSVIIKFLAEIGLDLRGMTGLTP